MGDVPPSEVNALRAAGEKKVSVAESDATIPTKPGESSNDYWSGGDVMSHRARSIR